MPLLVHLADEKNRSSIKTNGIKIGKYQSGIFCMPVMPNFYVSHQWLRELKRGGANSYVGVYFKIDSKELVYAGKFNDEHKHISLGEAIKEIMNLADPLGYELILNRKINPKEIEKIKRLPQKIGWRYYPTSHGKRPTCTCPICIPSGSIKGKQLRDKLEPPIKPLGYHEALAKLKLAETEDEIESLLWAIKRTTRRSNPHDLDFLLNKNSTAIMEMVASALSRFKHKNTKTMLMELVKSKNDQIKVTATNGLLDLCGLEIEKTLIEMNDPVISNAVKEWKDF